jgi:hypothetical protein
MNGFKIGDLEKQEKCLTVYLMHCKISLFVFLGCDRPRMGQMFIEQCGLYYIRPLQGRTRIETAILL